ncbi:MAG: acylphosphatase [Erysipelotrichaceae bacterium]|nr:acylphosphatase [Erysipelotrichaceae bacterium]
MKRYYIVYEGRVQGVGFRYYIYRLALKYNITGYVRNMNNGNVEAEVQGEDVDEFFKKSLEGDRFINVIDYSIKELPLKDETEFKVTY